MKPENKKAYSLDDADELTPAMLKQACDTLRQIKGGVPIHVIETAQILIDPDIIQRRKRGYQIARLKP